MRTLNCFALITYLLVSAAAAAEKNDGYNAFRFVRLRNVFDPNRSGLVREQREERPSFRPRRPDSLSLTGTMVTAGKTLAFFSGSRSEYNKVIPAGDTVGRFKLGEITSSGVTLEKDGKPTTLAIGRQLTIAESGATTEEPISTESPVESPTTDAPAASIDASAASGDASRAEVSAAPPSAAAPSSGGMSEVMRKMIERRQKEMSK